jgi:hypothetical protein
MNDLTLARLWGFGNLPMLGFIPGEIVVKSLDESFQVARAYDDSGIHDPFGGEDIDKIEYEFLAGMPNNQPVCIKTPQNIVGDLDAQRFTFLVVR